MISRRDPDFSDLDGKPPQKSRKAYCPDLEASDRIRRIDAWQSWVEKGREPIAPMLGHLADSIRGLQNEFMTHGSFDLEFEGSEGSLALGVGDRMLNFPCSSEEVESVLDGGDLAGFGHGGRNVVDPHVRSTIEYSRTCPLRISTGTVVGKATNRYVETRSHVRVPGCECGDDCDGQVSCRIFETMIWPIDSSPFLTTIQRSLFPSFGALRFELYKFLIYRQGDHFNTPHVDTARGPAHVGTLVVLLPLLSRHRGGRLCVSHEGKTSSVDFAARDSSHTIQWAAFFASCTHYVEPVKEGIRAVLIYNIYAEDGSHLDVETVPTPTLVPRNHLQSEVEVVARMFAQLLTNPNLPRRPLAALMRHEYPWISCCEVSQLKGSDCLVFQAAHSLGLKCCLQPIIVERARGTYTWDLRQTYRVYRSCVPMDTVLKLTIKRLFLSLGLPTSLAPRVSMFLAQLPEMVSSLPMSVTWVELPQTPLGFALMDAGSQGRYTGNEIGEEVLHYSHVALLVSTCQSSLLPDLLETEWSANARFAAACRAGAQFEASRLLGQGPPVNSRAAAGQLALATTCGNAEVVGMLLERNVSPQAADHAAGSALSIAIKHAHGDCVRRLASFGAELDEFSLEALQSHPSGLQQSLEDALFSGLAASGVAGIMAFCKLQLQQKRQAQNRASECGRAVAARDYRICSLLSEVKSKQSLLNRVLHPPSAEERTLQRFKKRLEKKLKKRGRRHVYQRGNYISQLQAVNDRLEATLMQRLRYWVQEDLPEGWQSCWSEQHQRTFYFHSPTGQSSWFKPPAPPPPSPSCKGHGRGRGSRNRPSLNVLPFAESESDSEQPTGSEPSSSVEETAEATPVAVIDEEEAILIQEEQWASQVEARIARDNVEQVNHTTSTSGSVAENADLMSGVILQFNRHPEAFTEALLNSELSREVEAAGGNVCPYWARGAKVFIVGLTQEVLENAGLPVGNLRPYHVIVGEDDEQRVHDALQIMPYQLRPRVKRSSQRVLISVSSCSHRNPPNTCHSGQHELFENNMPTPEHLSSSEKDEEGSDKGGEDELRQLIVTRTFIHFRSPPISPRTQYTYSTSDAHAHKFTNPRKWGKP